MRIIKNLEEIKIYTNCCTFIDKFREVVNKENSDLLWLNSSEKMILTHYAAHIKVLIESIPNCYNLDISLADLINSVFEILCTYCDMKFSTTYPEEVEVFYKEQPNIIEGKEFYVINFLSEDLELILNPKNFQFTEKESTKIKELQTWINEKGFTIRMMPCENPTVIKKYEI